MVDEIVADGVVTVRLDRDAELRAHAVRARDEHRALEVGGDAEHAAEAAERAARTRRERRLDDGADALLDRVGAVDVDAGARVVERPLVAHARHAPPRTRRAAGSRRRARRCRPA